MAAMISSNVETPVIVTIVKSIDRSLSNSTGMIHLIGNLVWQLSFTPLVGVISWISANQFCDDL